MYYERWRSDTIALAETLPLCADVTARFYYLATEVARRGIESTPLPLQENATLTLNCDEPFDPEENFFVINKEDLAGNKLSAPMAAALASDSEAFVWHTGLGTILALGNYKDTSPLGNALLLSHELTHVSDAEEGFIYFGFKNTDANRGKIERRAYELNANTFRAFDDSQYDQYALFMPYIKNSLPIIRHGTKKIAEDGSIHNPYRPPVNTFMDEVWQEGQNSRLMLLTSSLVTYWAAMNYSRGDYIINSVIGKNLTPVQA